MVLRKKKNLQGVLSGFLSCIFFSFSLTWFTLTSFFTCFISPIFTFATLYNFFYLFSNCELFFFFFSMIFTYALIFCNYQSHCDEVSFHCTDIYMLGRNHYLLLTCSLVDRFIGKGICLCTVSGKQWVGMVGQSMLLIIHYSKTSFLLMHVYLSKSTKRGTIRTSLLTARFLLK